MKTFNVIGYHWDSQGKQSAYALAWLTAARVDGQHAFDAGWERDLNLAMEFSSRRRAQQVADLVCAWGLCNVVAIASHGVPV
jgi:hypothetical protein